MLSTLFVPAFGIEVTVNLKDEAFHDDSVTTFHRLYWLSLYLYFGSNVLQFFVFQEEWEMSSYLDKGPQQPLVPTT